MGGSESSFRMLKILDRFQGIISRMGVDYATLRRILHVKLLMDSRRAPVILSSSNRKKEEEQDKNLFVSSLWLYGLIGLVLTPFVFWSNPEYLMPMSILSAILMFLIMSSMISDFSSVLLDVRDRSILMTKPIDGRTVGLARSIHAGIYLLLLTGALSAGSLVVGLFKHGVLFFLIYILELILMNMLILVSTSLVYLLLLKYWDGEKLKDLINYVQIGLSAALAIGYQFVIRSFDLIDFNLVFTPAWWQILLPPVWFAAPYEWLFGEGSGWLTVLSLLAVLVPIVLMIVYVRYIPSFEQHLEKLAHSEAGKGRERGRLDRFLAKLVCRSRTEQACFRLSASMLKNEREFKLKVYPTLGLSVLLPYLFFVSTIRNSSLAEISQGSSYYVLHSMLIMIITVVMMLKFSGKPKAFWLFGAAPMPSMNPLYQGALKAFAVKMFLPLFTVNAVIFLILFGSRIIPDVLIVFLTGLVLIPLSAKSILRTPPFSQAFNMAQQKDGRWVLLFFIVVGGLCGLHYASSALPYGMLAYILTLLVANGLAWTKLYK